MAMAWTVQSSACMLDQEFTANTYAAKFRQDFVPATYRVRYFRGRVSNLPLLLAEEGSQITTFGGRRVPNFTFLTQNFWREKGLKSQQIGGRRVSNEDFTPLKVAV